MILGAGSRNRRVRCESVGDPPLVNIHLLEHEKLINDILLGGRVETSDLIVLEMSVISSDRVLLGNLEVERLLNLVGRRRDAKLMDLRVLKTVCPSKNLRILICDALLTSVPRNDASFACPRLHR